MKCEITRGDDMSLDEYFSKMLALDNIEIDAGFLTAVRHPESDLTIPAIAAIQQFGNETTIPCTSVFNGRCSPRQ